MKHVNRVIVVCAYAILSIFLYCCTTGDNEFLMPITKELACEAAAALNIKHRAELIEYNYVIVIKSRGGITGIADSFKAELESQLTRYGITPRLDVDDASISAIAKRQLISEFFKDQGTVRIHDTHTQVGHPHAKASFNRVIAGKIATRNGTFSSFQTLHIRVFDLSSEKYETYSFDRKKIHYLSILLLALCIGAIIIAVHYVFMYINKKRVTNSTTVVLQFANAERLFSEGFYDDALKYCQKVLAVSPNYPKAVLLQNKIVSRQREHQKHENIRDQLLSKDSYGYLRLTNTILEGSVFLLNDPGGVQIGSFSSKCQIVVHLKTVSKQHCWIGPDVLSGHVVLIDTSKNGTFINGKRYKNLQAILHGGDMIQIGDMEKKVSFIYYQ